MKPITVVFVLVIVGFVSCQEGITCQERTEEILRSKYSFENYNDFVKYLYSICITDTHCTQAYFQHTTRNFSVFKYLIGNLLSRYSSNKNVIYFNPIEIMTEMICEKEEAAASLVPLFSVQESSEGKMTQLSSSAGELVDHIIKSNSLYTMYSHATASNPTCGLGQKLVVSNDGSMVSCACQENTNCASSMHNTTYINVSIALVLFFVVMILGVLAFNTAYHVQVLDNFQKRKDPTTLARLMRY
jgi:hypothetical protein